MNAGWRRRYLPLSNTNTPAPRPPRGGRAPRTAERRAGRSYERASHRTWIRRRPGHTTESGHSPTDRRGLGRIAAIRRAQHAAARQPVRVNAPVPERLKRARPWSTTAAVLGTGFQEHRYQVVSFRGATYVMDACVDGAVWNWVYRSRPAAIAAYQRAERIDQVNPAAGIHIHRI